MVLSKRERVIAIGTLIAVGAFALDRLVISRLWAQFNQTQAQQASLITQLRRDQELIVKRDQLAPKWREMIQTSMKNDPLEAESQILHAIRNWAEESGVTLSLLKLDRLPDKTRLPEITLQASGTGNLRSAARLLWRVQTAAMPIKVDELQITSRTPGADDLSFQFRLSTVYVPPSPAMTSAASKPSDHAGGRR